MELQQDEQYNISTIAVSFQYFYLRKGGGLCFCLCVCQSVCHSVSQQDNIKSYQHFYDFLK